MYYNNMIVTICYYDMYYIRNMTCDVTDHCYVDPLGELPERPKTAARQKPSDEDEFNDTELGEDLLPE